MWVTTTADNGGDVFDAGSEKGKDRVSDMIAHAASLEQRKVLHEAEDRYPVLRMI